MTDNTTGQLLDPFLQFDHLEHNLETFRDQLTRLTPYLAPSDLSKLVTRWESMRQALDSVLLSYGQAIPNLPTLMDDLPPLRDLDRNELELIREGLTTAKRTLQNFSREVQDKVPLLETALNIEDKPAKLRKCIEKMRVIDDGLQERVRQMKPFIKLFELAVNPPATLTETSALVVREMSVINGLKQANAALEAQEQEMRRWLAASRHRLDTMPVAPPPSPSALTQAGASANPARDDADNALASLYAAREKLREARRYLETILPKGEDRP